MYLPPRPFWPPLAAGVALGLILLLTFLLAGHGLGDIGLFSRLIGDTLATVAPEWAAAHPYAGEAHNQGSAGAWITWEMIGIVIGALAGAVSSGRFRAMVERRPSASLAQRLILAFLGGILAGFGLHLARGGFATLGLSGVATLAVAGFVFLLFFFVAGFAVSRAMGRTWH